MTFQNKLVFVHGKLFQPSLTNTNYRKKTFITLAPGGSMSPIYVWQPLFNEKKMLKTWQQMTEGREKISTDVESLHF